jgi:hypothetical protein
VTARICGSGALNILNSGILQFFLNRPVEIEFEKSRMPQEINFFFDSTAGRYLKLHVC